MQVASKPLLATVYMLYVLGVQSKILRLIVSRFKNAF
jgi:hypothetical protein